MSLEKALFLKVCRTLLPLHFHKLSGKGLDHLELIVHLLLGLLQEGFDLANGLIPLLIVGPQLLDPLTSLLETTLSLSYLISEVGGALRHELRVGVIIRYLLYLVLQVLAVHLDDFFLVYHFYEVLKLV